MRISSTVKGTGKVLANMENAIDEMRRQQIVALTRIGIKVKGDAMDNTRPSGNGTYWNPGGPKFLERAVNSNHKFILDELARAHP
jgi:hypothetical protein